MHDDEIRRTYNRAIAATDKGYPEAYLIGLRAIAAAAFDEGADEGEQHGLMPSMYGPPMNPYRDGSK